MAAAAAAWLGALACSAAPAAARPLVEEVFPAGLPWPFEAVVDQLVQIAGPGNVETALIPVGRSLQRFAAAPDFFASPRIVVAVTGDRASGPEALRLADRLFIGYQPFAEVIETISYDSEAGVFAFHEIVGYTPKGIGPLRPSERAVCLACHQGEGPIFARPLWNETNADPAVRARLDGLGESFHGVPVHQSIDALAAFDAATDRAARIAAASRLWEQGCPNALCRAALLAAAVRHGLGADPAPPTALAPGAGRFDRRSRERWPMGLATISPDLPNRRPPGVVDGSFPEAEGPFDPETPRPSLTLWHPDMGFTAAAREVAALLSSGDYGWIARHLHTRPGPTLAAADCASVPAHGPAGITEIRFTCVGAVEATGFIGDSGRGRIDSLALPGLPQVHGMRLAIGGTGSTRLADGRRLDGSVDHAGMLTLRIADDLAPLDAGLAAAALEGDPALGAGPFARTALLQLIAAILEDAHG